MRTPLIQPQPDLVSHPQLDRPLRRQEKRAKRFGILATSLLGLAMVTSGCLSPKLERRETIRYGQRKGHDLTYELMQPKRSNGLGVVVMVSGSWKSNPDSFTPNIGRAFLKRGYTLLALSHLSQPKATIPEIVEDVTQGMRHIRQHASDYGITAKSLGVTGASAGGHLALMMATRGKEWTPDGDPMVHAAAVFFPVTDMHRLGKIEERLADGGPPESFRKYFGIPEGDTAAWKVLATDLSPLKHVSPDLCPVLMIHGDDDEVVRWEQSQWFLEAAQDQGVTAKLITKPGKGHGWATILFDMNDLARWFDQHLNHAP